MPQTSSDHESPIGLREASRRERLARILNAAEELFSAKGFDQVTTREIAQRAGVGEATLFRYIPNKADLLLRVVGRTQEILIDELELADDLAAAGAASQPTGQGYIDRINEIYRARIHYYTTDPENVAQFVVSGLQAGSNVGTLSTRAGDRIISRVQSIVQAGQTAGVLRDDVDALIVARNINGTYIHEVLRSPARHLSISGTWDRLSERFDVMLRPLVKVP